MIEKSSTNKISYVEVYLTSLPLTVTVVQLAPFVLYRTLYDVTQASKWLISPRVATAIILISPPISTCMNASFFAPSSHHIWRLEKRAWNASWPSLTWPLAENWKFSILFRSSRRALSHFPEDNKNFNTSRLVFVFNEFATMSWVKKAITGFILKGRHWLATS